MGEELTVNADEAWLARKPLPQALVDAYYPRMNPIVVAGESERMTVAKQELQDGLNRLLGRSVAVETSLSHIGGLWVGTLAHLKDESWARGLSQEQVSDLESRGQEAYAIWQVESQAVRVLAIVGGSDRGVLYGVFGLLRQLASGDDLDAIGGVEAPTNAMRMIDHWDNVDGSVERGYAGRSLFFRDGQVLSSSPRLQGYARLLASVGLNAIAINNVNVHREESYLVTERYLTDVARVASMFRGYGIRLFLSVNFAAPMELDGLKTADPLDPEVIAWWQKTTDIIYRYIPDFGGFVVKADSEFRPGPFTYGRDHADGANLLARALFPHGGIVVWRCFVYDCQTDWRDRELDRARAAYDHFVPLDGRFDSGVVLQIKNGPMDFQVREPVSPLLGAMPRTAQMLELQITQEYTGQQRDLCYLVPQWKEVLEFDTYAKGPGSSIAQVASGRLFDQGRSGIAGVANAGNDYYWTGHPLAQANWYGFGRLAWDPSLTSERITREWIRQTLSDDETVVSTISRILLDSWKIYEDYTAPLGVGWMVNPGHHYGPNVDGYEYSKWGTYHFADHLGIGVDRTQGTGTGYVTQYREPHRSRYQDLTTCPDDVLLFFHHVPYQHRLHSGTTVIQHIYDRHFAGVKEVRDLEARWRRIAPALPKEFAETVAERFRWQLKNAEEWRDVVNTYFYRKSGIADDKGRFIVP